MDSGETSTEELRVALLNEGMKEEDVEAALSLGSYIRAVHSLVFPRSPSSTGIAFMPFRSLDRSLAGYFPGRKFQKETYVIHVDGLAGSLNRRALVLDVTTALSEHPDLAEIKEAKDLLMLGIAVHEVRHRVQILRPDIFFSRRGIKSMCSPILVEIALFCHTRFRVTRKRLKEEGKTDSLIRKIFSRIEFDASVVEMLVLSFVVNQEPSKFLLKEIGLLLQINAPLGQKA